MKRTSFLTLLIVIIGAMFLAACSGGGGSSGGSNSPVKVNVTETEFQIQADTTSFKVGTPYQFVVTNKGTTSHEFLIMKTGPASMTADEVKAATLASLTQDQLTAGATKTLDYTFTDADAGQSLEFACRLPGHYEGGMHTPITVTK